MIIKTFKIGEKQKLFLQSLLGDSLRGLYAPQLIQLMEEKGNNSYIGDKIFITTKSNKTISLEQYTLNDRFLIDESNNLKLEFENDSLISLQPNLLNKGYYLDFIHGGIEKIEIFAHLSYQYAEDENSEICIKDENNKAHYFTHIECEYIIRFHLEKQLFSLMLDNQRYFTGSNDFISRFRILDNDNVEKLINSR
jgi:hypothetical protein